MDWHKSLYEIFGAQHPILSLIIACAVGAVVSGFSWYIIGRDYDKTVAAQKAKITASLKERATTLSSEILLFLAERKRDEPPTGGRNSEEWQRNSEANLRYSRETMNQYSTKFAVRVIAMRNELKEQGLTDEELERSYQHAVNPLGIEAAGKGIGALAERLPAPPP